MQAVRVEIVAGGVSHGGHLLDISLDGRRTSGKQVQVPRHYSNIAMRFSFTLLAAAVMLVAFASTINASECSFQDAHGLKGTHLALLAPIKFWQSGVHQKISGVLIVPTFVFHASITNDSKYAADELEETHPGGAA